MIKESEDLFYQDIKQLLIDARKDVYRKINSLMVETYWEIGRRIVEQEQQGKGRAGYGEYLITNLSKYLGDTFGKGFSVANLKNFRQFYLSFRENQKLYTLCRELSWSHIRLIMRIDDKRAKEFYLTESRREGWSVRTLQRNMKSRYFERLLSSQTPGKVTGNTESVGKLSHIKDPYVRMFDDLKRGDDDNPTIGIILCTDKDETIVKYSVLQENKHLFASKYRTVLPSEQELQEELDREKWIVSEKLNLYGAEKSEQDYE